MIDVFIIHGSFGSPYQNWAPWLYDELTKAGKKVLVPHFTADALQDVENWTAILDGYSHLIDSDTCFVAHSLGPAFCVNWIARHQTPVQKFVAVAPFYGLIDIPEFDEVNKSFFIDKELISQAAGLIASRHAVYANNDPYVPIAMSKEFARSLGATETIIPNGGHLNTGAGFSQFPKLLDIVLG